MGLCDMWLLHRKTAGRTRTAIPATVPMYTAPCASQRRSIQSGRHSVTVQQTARYI